MFSRNDIKTLFRTATHVLCVFASCYGAKYGDPAIVGMKKTARAKTRSLVFQFSYCWSDFVLQAHSIVSIISGESHVSILVRRHCSARCYPGYGASYGCLLSGDDGLHIQHGFRAG